MVKINNKIIAIYGPTISSKTGLAIDVAKYVWGKYNIESELISADSRKIYKDLTIGQVPIWTPYDKKIKVHMFKFIDSLEEFFSLYDYKIKAEEIINQIHKQNHLPVLFGGSAMYISSVLENWNVPKDYKSGTNYRKKFGKSKSKYDYIILIPKIRKTMLFRKIRKHVEENHKIGILEELKGLVKKYRIDPLSKPTDNMLYKSLEYREFLEYCFKNKKNLEELDKKDLKIIKINSVSNLKDFARRQIRWIPKIKSKKYPIGNWKQGKQIIDEFLS